jgi:hypothetical protein
MHEDPRCCGSGTCIIDAEGRCWCGQQWDGERMGLAGVRPAAAAPAPLTPVDDEDPTP